MRAERKTGRVRQYIEQSGIMPVTNTDILQPNIVSGRLLMNKDARKDFLFHSIHNDEKEAAIYIWNHPEKLKFVRKSPFGEGKDRTKEKDIKNLAKKKKRGAIGYNQYKFRYNKKTYYVKLEERKKGFEVPYHIERKKT